MSTILRKHFHSAVVAAQGKPSWIRAAITLSFLTAIPEAVAQSASLASTEKRPNFVFIISDDHRWDALGAAGNTTISTPTLDRLAREGAYFRQATVTVAQCAPNRAVLLTGLPPHSNGIYSIQSQRRDLWWKDELGTVTMPALLAKAGYHDPPARFSSSRSSDLMWFTSET